MEAWGSGTFSFESRTFLRPPVSPDNFFPISPIGDKQIMNPTPPRSTPLTSSNLHKHTILPILRPSDLNVNLHETQITFIYCLQVIYSCRLMVCLFFCPFFFQLMPIRKFDVECSLKLSILREGRGRGVWGAAPRSHSNMLMTSHLEIWFHKWRL